MAPSTTLPELAEVMRRARMFLGSDTGPLHLAAAVNTPCVALFGATLPKDCGPYGSQHITVQKSLQAGTSHQRRKGSNDAMREIDPDSAIEACERLLNLHPGQYSRSKAA